MNVNIVLNERDYDRLKAIAKMNNMDAEYCAVGLIQQSLRIWEKSKNEKH